MYLKHKDTVSASKSTNMFHRSNGNAISTTKLTRNLCFQFFGVPSVPTENNRKIDALSLISRHVCLLAVEMDCEDFESLGENLIVLKSFTEVNQCAPGPSRREDVLDISKTLSVCSALRNCRVRVRFPSPKRYFIKLFDWKSPLIHPFPTRSIRILIKF